ncbi:MAG TPA: long-chain fatty acid--CoA ligase [Candidatus Nitrosotenuis sp.]|nr:long-chain fatty acid--CoA ligase [Candidatus Nitrosotenuis sp.]
MSLVAGAVPNKALEEWAKTASVKTIPQLFRQAVDKVGSRPFLGEKVAGSYQFRTYKQIQTLVHDFAAALIDLGLEPGDRVALFSNNRPEWVITDLGAMHAGCVSVPLYATLAEGDVKHILTDCGAKVVVTASEAHTQKVISVEAQCPDLQHIVAIEPTSATSTKKLWTWTDFLKHGRDQMSARQAEIENRIANLQATDLATIVYTSGTTGKQKGAMLAHGNIVSNATTVVGLVNLQAVDVELSFLPLSHTFERIVYYGLIAAGASIGYAESIDTVADNLKELRPTVVPSVPRLFEKIHARVMAQAAASPLKAKIFDWALKVGREFREASYRGSVPPLLKLQHQIAHKLVFSKIHERTGGNVRFFISGGAPLRRDVGEFFLDAGFLLLEGYGLTETSPVLTVNPPHHPKIGTVGKPIPHVEIKIADDGEILCKGPNIMLGYFGNEQATREVIDEQGWFHTGDIGRFDEDGYLMITDRKKELLVMSNGKNVAPQPIENALKSSPFIEQAVVIGDNRNFISALVVPDFAALEAWAKGEGVPTERSALCSHPKTYEKLMSEVNRLCADMNSYERVKKICILEREMTLESGELTPTLKVKRRVVNEKYKDKIEAMYAETATTAG